LAAEEAAGYDPLPSQKSFGDYPDLSESQSGCCSPLRINTSQRFSSYLERLQRRRTTASVTSPVLAPRPQPALRIPSPDYNTTHWERFLRHRHVQRVCANLMMNRMDSYHAGIPLTGQSPRKHYRRWKKELKLAQRTF